MIFRAISATAVNQVASPAKPRNFLGIFNQSASTIYVAFDAAAVAAATAGQITLAAAGSVLDRVVFDGTQVPTQAVNIIASAPGAVTLVE